MCMRNEVSTIFLLFSFLSSSVPHTFLYGFEIYTEFLVTKNRFWVKQTGASPLTQLRGGGGDFMIIKKKKQAGAELYQAQVKLG